MAERRDPRSEALPVPHATPPQLFGRSHTYGVAHDLERMRQGVVPPPRTPRVAPRGRRRRGGGPWASLLSWWASRDRRPVDVWHRIRCRTGHHDIRGGHQVQLGSRFVHVERRCVWCDAEPSF